MVYFSVVIIAVLALVYVAINHVRLRRMNEGTEEMVDISGIIRRGARTFMRAEYKIIIPVIIIVAAIFSCLCNPRVTPGIRHI